MNKHKTKLAFTLVELIVVIVILAILGTIAFISLQWYSKDARDSTRVSDISTMKTSLELFHLDTGKYPLTTDGFTVTYSGSDIWNQWNFWEDTFSNVQKLDDIPIDPLTSKKYTYSVTKTRQEFQIAGIMEGEWIASVNSTYAWDTLATALVSGNYNGKILKNLSGSLCEVLTLPSIISSEPETTTNLVDIFNSEWLVYHWYKNLPSTYRSSKFKADGWFAFGWNGFVTNNFIAYSDNENCQSLYDSEDSSARDTLIFNLKDAYSSTVLENEDSISSLVNLNPSDKSSLNTLGVTFVNNNLWWTLALKNVWLTTSLFAILDPASNDVWILSQNNTKIIWQNVDEAVFSNYTMESWKYYWEVEILGQWDRNYLWISDTNSSIWSPRDFGTNNGFYSWFNWDVLKNNSVVTSIWSAVSWDIISFAFDADIWSLWLAKNSSPNTWWAAQVTWLPQTAYYAFYEETSWTSTYSTNIFNFWQDSSFWWNKTSQWNSDDNWNGDFYYQPPVWYIALSSYNWVCWVDHGWTFTSTPTNLCNEWVASVVVNNWAWATYTWSCWGINGWNTVNCSAVNGNNPVFAVCTWSTQLHTATTTYWTCGANDIIVCDWVGSWYVVAACNHWATSTNTASVASYWNYYQWWNNASIKTAPTSTSQVWDTTFFPPSTYNSAVFRYFVHTWTSVPNTDLWWDATNTDEARRWPCDAWYHVPTVAEWTAISSMYSWYGIETALNLPRAGYRYWYDANMAEVWTNWVYWTSEWWGWDFAKQFNTSWNIANNYITQGQPVRCFKNL